MVTIAGVTTPLSLDDARRLTLRAQGFIGASARKGGVPAMLRRVGGVQLDTISVLARSHELVPYARLGPIPRARIERAYWPATQPPTFEYWAWAIARIASTSAAFAVVAGTTCGMLAANIPVVFLGLHLAVSVIQAFIFMLLAMIYLSQAATHEAH